MEPKQLTHTMRTDVLNKDASVKRIEIDFCSTDHWSDCLPGILNIAEMFQSGINEMISLDQNTVGSQQTIINAKTCIPIEGVRFYPIIAKSQYFQNSENNK